MALKIPMCCPFVFQIGLECSNACAENTGSEPAGTPLLSYTIMTTAPKEFVKRFHDRMPVVLDESECGRWLMDDDPRDLLKPCHNETLTNYPVSRRVNAVRNDDASLIEPLAA